MGFMEGADVRQVLRHSTWATKAECCEAVKEAGVGDVDVELATDKGEVEVGGEEGWIGP